MLRCGGDAGALLMKRPPCSSLWDISDTIECRRASPNSEGASSGVSKDTLLFPTIERCAVVEAFLLSSAASSVATGVLPENLDAVASSSIGLPST